MRWRAQLADGCGIKELAALFARGEKENGEIFPLLCQTLNLGATVYYGFSSLEDAGLQGVVRLYFRASNVVKQRLRDKPGQLVRHVSSRCV